MGGAVGLTGVFPTSLHSVSPRGQMKLFQTLSPVFPYISSILPILKPLPVSGAILNNIIKARLNSHLPQALITQITSSAYALSSLDLIPPQHELVLDAYMSGMHSVFIMYAPVIGACFIAASLVKDRGVAEKDANAAERNAVARNGDNVEMMESDGHGNVVA